MLPSSLAAQPLGDVALQEPFQKFLQFRRERVGELHVLIKRKKDGKKWKRRKSKKTARIKGREVEEKYKEKTVTNVIP